MRTLVILNPQADHGRAIELKEKILAWGSKYGRLDLVFTEGPGHARHLAAAAGDAGFELVVAAGGDGTVHEVVNGLVRGGRSQSALGLIPIGSANDFAFGLDLLADLETAVHRLFNGMPRVVDLAIMEDERGHSELAINGIGIGFDASVTIQSKRFTRVHGFAMYTLAALRTIALYFQTPHLEIRFDDERIEQDVLLLAVGIGPRIGGGFFLTPEAIHDDQLLDSCTVDPVSRLTMLRMLPRVMKGTHVTAHFVTMRRSRNISVKSSLPLPIHVDGEIFAFPEDNVRQVSIKTLPAALSIMGAGS